MKCGGSQKTEFFRVSYIAKLELLESTQSIVNKPPLIYSDSYTEVSAIITEHFQNKHLNNPK